MAAPKKSPSRNHLGTPPTNTSDKATAGNNTQKPATGELVPLNFKVESEFKKALKIFSTAHDMSMVDVLKEAVEKHMKEKGS